MYRFITMAMLIGSMVGNALTASAVGISKSTITAMTKSGMESAQPAGQVIPNHGDWAAFVRVKGENFASAMSVRVYWYPDDDDSKPPLMNQTATWRGHSGTDEITIQIPTDPAKSGWSGDWAKGVLRIYLIMPGQKQPLFAARYTVGGVLAKNTIAQSRNVKSGTAPATTITTPVISVTGSGPVSSVMTSEIAVAGSGPVSSVMTGEIAVAGSGPASNITTSTITVTGAGPVTSVTTAMIAVTGSGPTSSVSVSPISVIGTNELIRRKIPPQ